MCCEFADRIDRDFKTTRVQYNKLLRTVQADIIYSSDVCLSTCLSSVGYEAASTDFPIVFVDEAGQCDEPMTLIPLTKGSRHVVLIGDHKQLPAVCSSAKARWKGLNSSLFERLNFQACMCTRINWLCCMLTDTCRSSPISRPVYTARCSVQNVA